MKSKKINSLFFLLNIGDFNFQNTYIKASIHNNATIQITNSSIESNKEMDDYILGTNDYIYIEFRDTPELNNVFKIDEQGELFLPRIRNVYVKGLVNADLKKLEEKYSEYLINPEIQTKIVGFKAVKITLDGEVRMPVFISPSFKTNDLRINNNVNKELISLGAEPTEEKLKNNIENSYFLDRDTFRNFKKPNLYNVEQKIATLTSFIRKAGGITSFSDISNIEIIREVSKSQGGGKKRAFFDLRDYLDNPVLANDIRLFYGDKIIVPKLNKSDNKLISKSIKSGLSPKFVEVSIFGSIENPGTILLPQGSSITDLIDLTGPVRPLSGKVVLMKYLNDGSFIKKKINYSFNAPKGSKRNPYILEGDYISVKQSIFGKSAGIIKTFTEPFVGIYGTIELIEKFQN